MLSSMTSHLPGFGLLADVVWPRRAISFTRIHGKRFFRVVLQAHGELGALCNGAFGIQFGGNISTSNQVRLDSHSD